MLRLVSNFLKSHEIDYLANLAIDLNNWTAGPEGKYLKSDLFTLFRIPGSVVCDLVERAAIDYVNAKLPVENIDVSLIRMDEGNYISPHRDPGARPEILTTRLHAVIKSATRGGVFKVAKTSFGLGVGNAIMFSPDLYIHEVTPVKGQYLVLSIGVFHTI